MDGKRNGKGITVYSNGDSTDILKMTKGQVKGLS